jgi:integrase
MDGYKGTLTVRCALRLASLVFVRSGELRKAQWEDIDLDAAEWRYTVTKTNTPHIVPLSRQAVEILRELHPLIGHGRFVFPGARSNGRPMSDNAILAAMRRLGIGKDEMSGHGFRAVARTILDEVLGVRPDYIEHQLAHAVRDPNGRAYNRTAHLSDRRKMMQQWADYLDQLKTGEMGEEVVTLHGHMALTIWRNTHACEIQENIIQAHLAHAKGLRPR